MMMEQPDDEAQSKVREDVKDKRENEDDGGNDEAEEQSPSAAAAEEMACLNNDSHKTAAAEEGQVDSEWHSPFTESTYTLLYMCGMKSQAFWYAGFVYLIQLAIILMTLIDAIDPWGGHSADNALNVPPNVGLTVTIAQAVTIFIALAYQSDLIESVLKLHDGYYPEVMAEGSHPEASFSSWLVSCVAQLIAGMLLLATIFILTMQVDNVVSIMLNFAALHFMAEIDDVGFYIAKMGFITNQLQRESQAVINFQVPKRDKGNYLRRLLYVATMVGLFVGYGILKGRQLQGYYLQTYLYVQFGDSHNPKFPYYSGLLTSGDVRTSGYREYRDVGTQNILLAYCYKERAWTFSENNEPCEYFAKSPTTRTFDVTTIDNSQWAVLDPHLRLVPFESFTLVGRDCDETICQGTCVDGLCQCPTDHFGLDCEFSRVCPELGVDGMTPSFPAAGGYAVSDSFQLFLDADNIPVRVYGMPVYYSNQTFPATIIFFGGHRWVLTSELSILEKDPSEMLFSGGFFPEETAAVLQSESFHAHHDADYVPLFLSDPVAFRTNEFQATPIGLGWSTTANRVPGKGRFYGPAYQVPTLLICRSCFGGSGSFCDSSGGVCNTTSGFCECFPGYSGDRCEQQQHCYEQQRPCHGRGLCDTNTGICRCLVPSYGKLCEHDYYCLEEHGKCFNNGICNPVNGSEETLHCQCPDPGTGGPACEGRNDCTYNGCQNGGICDETTRRCVCEDPFYGFDCRLVNKTLTQHLCTADDDCMDDGTTTCNVQAGICKCQDPNKYGALCEHQYNCTTLGCKNSGVCNVETEICECEEPYLAPDCGQVPDCTGDTDCRGAGGTCDIATGRCSCHDSIFATGKLCEGTKDCREAGGCYNDGVCQPNGFCVCYFPFTGSMCHLILADGSY